MTGEQLRKSILQLAIQGKLVKQDPNDEPASELVKKIYEEKKKLIAEGKIKKDKNESYIFKGEDNCYYEKINDGEPHKIEVPFEIPNNWTWVRLKNISNLNGGYAFESNLFLSHGIRVVRISDFDDKGILENEIKRTKYFSRLDPYKIELNDILMCMTGGTVGKNCIIEYINEDSYINQRIAKITSIILNSKFLHHALNSSYIISIINNSKTSTNDNISMDLIKEFLIPCPPIFTQNKIVNFIGQISSFIEKYSELKNKLQTLDQKFKLSLKNSIFKYAIEGKLVKQNLNDEPASELVKKIYEEKQKLISEGKIKKDKNESYIFKDNNCYYEKINNGKPQNIEVPFEIPENWSWVRLKTISEIYNGNSISKEEKEKKYTKCSGYDYIGTKDINFDFSINYDNGVYIPLNEKNFKIAPKNKILLCIEGGSAGKKIGITSKDVCFGNKLVCINDFLSNNLYLFYFLQSYYFKNIFNQLTTGIIGGISIQNLKNIMIPLPPKRECEKIIKITHKIISLLR
ncbi:restriction endonuclease subunit S [Malacoplasma penetrans]|uniref:restriction endonuclease subunit S n=1 Tax=Malacoplasma penetrans TaxID=28227 RepID=UPI0010115877|nr:restriction endonuclease subunit S [Malacoplasma penetrans]RXY96671.1 restriction endonuclease subunit S [Malacoplasma penetrans]